MQSGTWKLRGYDAFAHERYSIPGEFDSENDAMAAARAYLDELERLQPGAKNEGPYGLQDHVYVIRPDGTEFRVTD